MRRASAIVFSPGAALLPFGMPEIGMRGAGREDKQVVGHARPRAQHNFTRVAIQARDFAEHDLHAAIPAKDFPDGFGDVGGRQRRRGHLIEKRLKQVIVLPIDDGDRHAGATKRARHFYSAKATPDDDNAGMLHAHGRKTSSRAVASSLLLKRGKVTPFGSAASIARSSLPSSANPRVCAAAMSSAGE